MGGCLGAVSFVAEDTGTLRLRRGAFVSGSRRLATPQFFPIVNLLTGPPTPPNPLLANGGIWKWFKRMTLQDIASPKDASFHPDFAGVMTQVLHFADYHLSKDMVERWLPVNGSTRGKAVTRFMDQIAPARGHRPFLFVDSGGFKLLNSDDVDLSRYGWKARQRDILSLQLAFGGDLIASFDYPVGPATPESEALRRMQKSRENALWALKELHARHVRDKFLFLAVHGRTRAESYSYTRSLLHSVRRRGLLDQPFGLAIGSLVPLNNAPSRLIDVLAGALDALREADFVDATRVPVHAFGVNSTVAPLLALLGVDTYDGSSYVQGAQNLTYYEPGRFTPLKLQELTELACKCRGCTLMQRGEWVGAPRGAPARGLGAVQYILSDKTDPFSSYIEWHDGFVDDEREPVKSEAHRSDDGLRKPGVPKSYFYALLAVHNVTENYRQLKAIQDATRDEKVLVDFLAQSAKNPKARRIISSLGHHLPKINELLWRAGVSAFEASLGSRTQAIRRPPKVESPTKGRMLKSRRNGAAKDPELDPSAFNVRATDYTVPRGAVLLLLPCSQRKPYSASASHRVIDRALGSAGVDTTKIEKVTISGNYGPVPKIFEEAPAVLNYEFLLTRSDKKRIALIAKRTEEFLVANEKRFAAVVGYSTQHAYRKVMEAAFRDVANARLLPSRISRHTAAEFRKPKHLAELTTTLSGEVKRLATSEVRG